VSDFDLWDGKQRKEDGSGRANFDERAHRWFQNYVKDWLTRADDNGRARMLEENPDLDAVVEWYCEQPMRYLRWNHQKRITASDTRPVRGRRSTCTQHNVRQSLGICTDKTCHIRICLLPDSTATRTSENA
jgi:hypothetical protein